MISVRPAGQVFVCGKNFNVAIFSDTINMINVKICMVVIFIELYPFKPLLVTLTISRSQQCQTVLTENFICLSNYVAT